MSEKLEGSASQIRQPVLNTNPASLHCHENISSEREKSPKITQIPSTANRLWSNMSTVEFTGQWNIIPDSTLRYKLDVHVTLEKKAWGSFRLSDTEREISVAKIQRFNWYLQQQQSDLTTNVCKVLAVSRGASLSVNGPCFTWRLSA